MIICQKLLIEHTDISKVTLKLLFCLCVLFYSSFVYVFLQIQSPLRECCSIRSGASRLPYYCALLVCVPAVLGLLAACVCVCCFVLLTQYWGNRGPGAFLKLGDLEWPDSAPFTLTTLLVIPVPSSSVTA